MEKTRKRSFTQYEAIQPFMIEQSFEMPQFQGYNQKTETNRQSDLFKQSMKLKLFNIKKEKVYHKKMRNNRNSGISQRSNENFSTIESLKKEALAIQTAEFMSNRLSLNREQSSSELNTPLAYVTKDYFMSTKRVSLIETFRQKLKAMNQRPKQQKKSSQLVSLQLNQNKKQQNVRRRYLSEKKSCSSLTAIRFYKSSSAQSRERKIQVSTSSNKVLCLGKGYKRSNRQLSFKSKATL